MGEIYRLDFPNGKSYVGLTTKTAKQRFHIHKQTAKSGKVLPLYNAWRKHGEPVLVVLESDLFGEALLYAEIWAIARANTYAPNGYNVAYGGQVSPMLNPDVAAKFKGDANVSRRPEVRAKLSAANLRPEVQAAARERVKAIAGWNKGLKSTAEHRANMSAGAKARNLSPELRQAYSLATLGKKKTLETRARMSEAQKKRFETEKPFGGKIAMHDPAVRAKVSEAQKGRVFSDETRARMSESARRRCERKKNEVVSCE